LLWRLINFHDPLIHHHVSVLRFALIHYVGKEPKLLTIITHPKAFLRQSFVV
jgi:hypothetical protein